jgi:hypothetical protein
MGQTTLKITFGELQLSRIGKWRSLEGYDPTKSNDSFVRDMTIKMLDEKVPGDKKP